MAKNDSTPLFNPMMLWADMSMRALESTLGSTQEIGDGVDRLIRADASPAANELDEAPAIADVPILTANPGLALAMQLQRSSFEMLAQGWRQWFQNVGTLASLGAGSTFGEAVARQNPRLNAMHEVLQTAGTEEPKPRRQGPSARSRSKARSRGH
jgi:hypothetical protein